MSNVVVRSQVPEFKIEVVEGEKIEGVVKCRQLLHGTHALMLEVTVRRGTATPRHSHDHDSLLYVVAGRVRVTVGLEVGEAGPGDAILHPAGVEHVSEAVEDSIWIEVKAPPEATWRHPVVAGL